MTPTCSRAAREPARSCNYRDPAAIFSDQLKQIWIDTEIELVETATWLPRLIRGDFTFAQSLVGSGLDDPDQNFYENYICDSNRNYTKYCNRDLDKLIDQQSTRSGTRRLGLGMPRGRPSGLPELP